MTLRNDHLRAQDLLLARQIAGSDQAWLEEHLVGCDLCSDDAAAMMQASSEVRAGSRQIVAQRSLVRSTQSRVRERAAEMREQDERMAPLWIAVALAGLWAIVSVPFIWTGVEYLGHWANLPALVWQTAAVFIWLMPTGIITALSLLTRGLRKVTE